MSPEFEWEKNGTVPNVIFLEGAISKPSANNRVELTGYYGAADKYIGALKIIIDIQYTPVDV